MVVSPMLISWSSKGVFLCTMPCSSNKRFYEGRSLGFSRLKRGIETLAFFTGLPSLGDRN